MAERRTRVLPRAPAAARPRPRAWLVVVVGALVAGILGMHALASHGTTGGAAGSVVVGVDASGAHEAHADMGRGSAAASSADDSHDQSGRHTSSMVMLCVVVLAAAAVTLLGLLAGGLRMPRLPDTFTPATARTSVRPWISGAGPPPEWQFSVIRC